jgi:hypothetical protein
MHDRNVRGWPAESCESKFEEESDDFPKLLELER